MIAPAAGAFHNFWKATADQHMHAFGIFGSRRPYDLQCWDVHGLPNPVTAAGCRARDGANRR